MTATALPASVEPAADVLALERAIAFALQLADDSEAVVLALELPALDPVELPPSLGSELDQARLRAVGPLYLAAQLETARLVPAAETLAGVFMSGGLQADLGPAAELLVAFWRGRHERFSPEERAAFFARVFGSPARTRLSIPDSFNAGFESLMIDVAQALYELDGPLGLPELGTTRLRGAALRLAENLLARNRGIPDPAARELVLAINAALAIFKDPMVQRSLGTRSVWNAVRAATARYVGEETEVGLHVERGRSGLTILAWLAESGPQLDALSRPHESVIAAAATWLQATLALAESARQR